MLVLSRKIGERIVITPPGHAEIVLTVVDVDGNKVRLGWDADKNVAINREEIQKKKDADKVSAVG